MDFSIEWAFTVGLTLIAALRVVRFVTEDTAAAPLRRAIQKLVNDKAKESKSPLVLIALNYLVRCAWCLSVWVLAAAYIVYAEYSHDTYYLPVVGILAGSWLISTLDDLLGQAPPERVVHLRPVEVISHDGEKLYARQGVPSVGAKSEK